jgi:hypothetical protein
MDFLSYSSRAGLRNEVKLKARELMSDQKLSKGLPPLKTLKSAVRETYGKGAVGDQLWKDILGSAGRTNRTVDNALNVRNQYRPLRIEP